MTLASRPMQNRRIAGHVVPAAIGEPAADHHVEVLRIERLQQLVDVLGDVLPVGIDLHDARVATLDCVAEAGAQRAARRPG